MQIDISILKAYETKLVETSAKGTILNKDSYPTLIRITPTGLYHLEKLLTSFVYFDAIVIDTPIFIEEIREEIIDAFNIDERLERAIIFKEYLDRVWAKFANKKLSFNWSIKSLELGKDIESIKGKISN